MLKLLGPINVSRGQALITLSKNVWNVNGSSILRTSGGGRHTLKPRLLSSQSELPPLPVPPLQVTLDKFLRSVRPLVSETEFQTTQELVKKFACGECGPALQKLLEERAKTSRNWLADWWLRTAYLEFRYPVVVWSSPGLVFPHQNVCNQDDQLNLAARVIAGALDFKNIIDTDKLPLERMGKDPLDMSQYKRILGTSRIPGVHLDSLHLADPHDPPKHIVVAYKNHYYEVPVYGENGQPLSEEQFKQQLCEIVSRPATPAVPIGILTSDQRDNWGKAYQELIKDSKNVCSLETIQKSLFLVCLDEPNPKLSGCDERTIAALEMVHGCGSKNNGANRWFDKTIQFVIGTKGELGVCYEHSPAEGPPIAGLMDHVVDVIKKGGLKCPSSGSAPKPHHLAFNLPAGLECAIETAEKNLDALVDDLEMYGYVYKGYGKEFPKSQKMSPDSYIQMAIQFAFYRLHKKPAAHYESASTRKYFAGRTETIRSCSCESVAFAKAMLDSSKSDQEKVKAMRDAVNGHKKYTIEAVNGCGVDRHLLGLKLIAKENGITVPDLFKDVAYVRSSHMRISTSQVAGKCEAFMCFGPLVNDGYACCYNPRPNEIHMGISAFRSCPETSAAKFREALEESFDDMRNVLCKTQKSKL